MKNLILIIGSLMIMGCKFPSNQDKNVVLESSPVSLSEKYQGSFDYGPSLKNVIVFVPYFNLKVLINDWNPIENVDDRIIYPGSSFKFIQKSRPDIEMLQMDITERNLDQQNVLQSENKKIDGISYKIWNEEQQVNNTIFKNRIYLTKKDNAYIRIVIDAGLDEKTTPFENEIVDDYLDSLEITFLPLNL